MGRSPGKSTAEQREGHSVVRHGRILALQLHRAKPLPGRAETLVDFTRYTRKDSVTCVSGEANQRWMMGLTEGRMGWDG
jgi:hypothetical protein